MIAIPAYRCAPQVTRVLDEIDDKLLDRVEEIAVIDEFLPAQLDQGAIEAACREAVQDVDAKGLRDVGRCMNALKQRYPGQMDFTKASTVVKGMLR